MSDNHHLEPMLCYIDEHLDQPLSVEELAQRAYLSCFHFIRQFQRVVHQTPHQYVMNRRLQKNFTASKRSFATVAATGLV